MTVLAHLSDLHLDGTRSRADRVRQVVSYLVELPGALDAVVVTGDLTENGAAHEYEQVRAVLRPLHHRFPVLACPGNHDDATGFAHHLGPLPSASFHDGVQVLMVDSTVPGVAHGLLSPATLRWLDDRLRAASRQPALIGLHHPPAAVGIPFTDAIGLRNADALASVLQRYPQVAGVLAGHAHAAAATTFAGVPLMVAPGLVSTAALPWEGTDGWSYQDDCVSLSFHTYAQDVLTTTVRTIPAR